ncbi:unnamed protein product [Fraxinus pennsylvanica]|uniref:Uncharacterized protein n=1 Tax=Fraxinus pennsylvanica TaxID=56036 RepID=A0AAD1ZQI1_9LAMI|nr:unnamed protein product [Fraxinus pennsylvanica]
MEMQSTGGFIAVSRYASATPLRHLFSAVNEEDGMPEPEVEGKAGQESEDEPEAVDGIHAESREKIQCSQEICIHDQSGGSKSLGITKDDKQRRLAAVFHDIFGDSDNEVHDSIKDDKQRAICDNFGDSDNEENGGTKDDKQRSTAVNRDIFEDSHNKEHDSTKCDKHHLAIVTPDNFGDCDKGEQADHIAQNQNDDNRRRLDKGKLVKERRPEFRVPDEDVPYEYDQEYADAERKEKATAPSPVLEIPQICPLADPDRMYMLKLSNLVAIDPKPFDPSTYVEQDFFGIDNSGRKRHIPLQNIVRWKTVKRPDGRTSGPFLSAVGFLLISRIVMSWDPKLPVEKFPYVIAYAPTEPFLVQTRKVVPPIGAIDVTRVVWFGLISSSMKFLFALRVESNARLVTWEDGSLQLLIGEQAFMVTELDTRENQAHLFLRHKNGILQSQGRISKKLQFLPSSDSQFSAILDATRNKNVKVKSCNADVISQWELGNKRKMEKQSNQPNKRLVQKGKRIHKCAQIVNREHQAPPGLLKDLRDNEQDFHEQQSAAQHFNENRENEAGASVFTFNEKKGPKSPLKLSLPDAKSSQGLRRESRNEEETYEDSEVEAEGLMQKVEESGKGLKLRNIPVFRGKL